MSCLESNAAAKTTNLLVELSVVVGGLVLNLNEDGVLLDTLSGGHDDSCSEEKLASQTRVDMG